MRGGWASISKNKLIFLAIAVITFCAFWIGYGLLESAKYEQQAKDKISEYAEHTSDKVARACVGTDKNKSIQCVNEAFEAKRDYEYNQSDLVAQRQSALWAYIMAAAAVIGIALSAVGVWLVKTTFDETRLANSIAKETLFRQLRAYATVESIERDQSTRVGEYPSFECVNITIHNSGSTPATCVKIIYNRIEVVDGVIVFSPTEVRMSDIGAQARKSADLAWVCWDSLFQAKLEIPRKISGQLTYRVVIPDENGEILEFVEPFDLDISIPKITPIPQVQITRMPDKTNFA
jgi:hypothetical protein